MDLGQAQKQWAQVAKAAAWLTGLATTFVVAPPLIAFKADDQLMLHFAQFVLAVLLGLFFVSPRRRPADFWRAVSLVALAAGVLAFFGYMVAHELRTVSYDTDFRLVIGDNLTSAGRAFVAKHPNVTPTMLVAMAAGNEVLWPKQELVFWYVVICALYTLALLSLSVSAMAMLEFLRARAPSPESGH